MNAPAVRNDRGFTLLGLLVVVAIINIGLGLAATSWVVVDKRAKEAELIWRGQQYVRALQCHRQQTGGLPDRLDELMESDCIRALYPDPMSRDGEWRLIRESDVRAEAGARGEAPAFSADGRSLQFDAGAGQIEPFPATGTPIFPSPATGTRVFPSSRLGSSSGDGQAVGADTGPAASSGARGSGDRARRLEQMATLTSSLQEASERLQSLLDRLERDVGGDGIVGVASSSTGEALRLYDGEQTYDAWHFVVEG